MKLMIEVGDYPCHTTVKYKAKIKNRSVQFQCKSFQSVNERLYSLSTKNALHSSGIYLFISSFPCFIP